MVPASILLILNRIRGDVALWWKRKPQEPPLVTEEDVKRYVNLVKTSGAETSSVEIAVKATAMAAYLFFQETRRLSKSTDKLLWVTMILLGVTCLLLIATILLVIHANWPRQ